MDYGRILFAPPSTPVKTKNDKAGEERFPLIRHTCRRFKVGEPPLPETSYGFRQERSDHGKRLRDKIVNTSTFLVGTIQPPFGFVDVENNAELKRISTDFKTKLHRSSVLDKELSKLRMKRQSNKRGFFCYNKDAKQYRIWSRIPECAKCRMDYGMDVEKDYVGRCLAGISEHITDGVYSLFREHDNDLVEANHQIYVDAYPTLVIKNEHHRSLHNMGAIPFETRKVLTVIPSSLVWHEKNTLVDDTFKIAKVVEDVQTNWGDCDCFVCEKSKQNRLSLPAPKKVYRKRRIVTRLTNYYKEVTILPYLRPATPCSIELRDDLLIKKSPITIVPVIKESAPISMPKYPRYVEVPLTEKIDNLTDIEKDTIEKTGRLFSRRYHDSSIRRTTEPAYASTLECERPLTNESGTVVVMPRFEHISLLKRTEATIVREENTRLAFEKLHIERRAKKNDEKAAVWK